MIRSIPFSAFVTVSLLAGPRSASAQLTGDSAAVQAALRMIDALGGRDAWARARTIAVDLSGHIATEAEPWSERYWIDLVVPRGRYQIRAGRSERAIAWTDAGGWETRDDVVEGDPALFRPPTPAGPGR